MPIWFTNRPKNSAEVIYSVGYGSSTNLMSAKTMAESEAYRELCMGGNGVTDAQDKLYRSDKNGAGVNIGTTVIRNKCANLDITGTEVADSKLIVNGTKFSYYVLIALPLGDINFRAQAKQQIQQMISEQLNAEKEFSELNR
jgi:hypothetical protein